MRSTDKYVKRKREEREDGGRKEEDIFKRSRMTEREKGVRSMFKELMEEMEGIRK